MKVNMVRTCHICGATKTKKGRPLEGNYCSTTCLDRARSRVRPSRPGLPTMLAEDIPMLPPYDPTARFFGEDPDA